MIWLVYNHLKKEPYSCYFRRVACIYLYVICTVYTCFSVVQYVCIFLITIINHKTHRHILNWEQTFIHIYKKKRKNKVPAHERSRQFNYVPKEVIQDNNKDEYRHWDVTTVINSKTRKAESSRAPIFVRNTMDDMRRHENVKFCL